MNAGGLGYIPFTSQRGHGGHLSRRAYAHYLLNLAREPTMEFVHQVLGTSRRGLKGTRPRRLERPPVRLRNYSLRTQWPSPSPVGGSAEPWARTAL